MEAAADEVVHASGGHRVERLRRELELAAAEQKLEHRGGRELRRRSEPAPLGIELLPKSAHGVRQQRRRQRLA